MALSLALGLWGVRRGGSMWRDEAVTYDMARRQLPDLWATLGHVDAVHGLYYLLLHALFGVAGDTDPLLVLRLPSVLAITAASGTLALLGRRLAGPRAGLLAGIVFALLPPVQRYAQEGRSYALVCALVVWATYLLVRGAWAGYGAVVLAACLLHEFAVLAPVAHLVALDREARRTGLRVTAGVCVALAPLAVLSMGQSEQVAWIGVGAGALLGVGATTAVGVACALLLRRTGRRETATVALPLLVLPPLLLLSASLVEPLYVDRYVLYAQAGTALLVGAALERVRIAVILVAALALTPFSVGLRTPGSRTDDVRAIAEAVREAGRGADGVVYLPARRRVWSLPDPTPFRDLNDLALAAGPSASHTLYGTEVPATAVRSRLLAASRIVALSDPAGQPLDRTAAEVTKRRVLVAEFEECGTWAVRGARVTVYARPGSC
ncbi:hypothetical protein [Streptomyces sp. NPDC094437]|uniref:glycosyltransferase family 39 protein n=1 Tax=Streptomyces sp. NPDC094437 TaxID=3366060 RepID=UPI0037FD2F7E